MPDPKFIGIMGELANHLEGVPLDNTPPGAVGSTENSLFPAYFQIDYWAIEACIPWVAESRSFNDNEGIPGVKFDKNQVFMPGAATGPGSEETTFPLVPLPGRWYRFGPASIELGGRTDTYCYQFSSSEEPGGWVQWVRARAENKVAFQMWLRGLGGLQGTCNVYIEELGYSLKPDGTWDETGSTNFASETGGTYVLHEALDVTMPDYDPLVPGGVYTVRIYLNGTGQADDIVFWHWTDTAAVIGHNAHPILNGLELYCSDDDFDGDNQLVTEFDPLIWPNTYQIFPIRGERWWKFVGVDANDVPLWYGQCWLAQKFEFDRAPNMDLSEAYHRELVELWTSGGRRLVYVKEDIRRVDVVFTWRHPSKSDFEQLRDRFFEQSGYGLQPGLIIRDDSNPASAHMVYVPKEYRTRFLETDVEVGARDVEEMVCPGLGYPVFTP